MASSLPSSHNIDSSDEDTCSRSAAISSAKRRHEDALFMTDIARSRKRKRRKKSNKLHETGTNESTCSGVPAAMHMEAIEDGTLNFVTCDVKASSLLSSHPSNSRADSAGQGSCKSSTAPTDKFQLFVHLDGEGESSGTNGSHSSNQQSSGALEDIKRKLKLVRRRHKTTERRGLAKDSGHGTRKQQPCVNGSCEQSLLPNAMFTNSHSSGSSGTNTFSNDVGKQGTYSNQLDGQLRENGPPTHVVDPDDPKTSAVMTTEGLSSAREVVMERWLQRRSVTRCRRRRLMTHIQVRP